MDWVQKRPAVLLEVTILLIFMTLMVLGSTAVAQAQVGFPQGASGRISLDVVDADLSKVVLMLAKESKQSIVIADQGLSEKKVTATLNDVPLETALRYVVESVGCTWSRQPDGVYIIGGKLAEKPSSGDTTAQSAYGPSIPLVEDMSSAYAGSALRVVPEAHRDVRVEVVKLYNTSPSEMIELLGHSERKQILKSEPMYDSGVAFQKADGDLEGMGFNLYATPPMMESLKSNTGSAERVAKPADEAAQAYPPSPPGIAPGRTTRPGQVAPGATPPGPGAQGTSASLLPEGIDYIAAYELDNSLIVRGDEDGISQLRDIIKLLDVAPKQIMIEAQFVSISRTDVASLGIDWDLQRFNTSLSTLFGPGGNVVIGYANGNLMATLRTQLRERKGKLVNAPKISTMNNQEASIQFQTAVPFTTTNTIFNSQGTPTTVTYTQIYPIVSSLQVRPRVNAGDNSITVEILPMISDTNEAITSGTVPVVNSQSLVTTRRVANGETIVIGGLTRNQDNVNVDKIPLLGELPLIGPLFRSTSKNVDDKELLIFLTPSIIPERPVSGAGLGVIP